MRNARWAEQQERERQTQEDARKKTLTAVNDSLRLGKAHLKEERFDDAAEAYRSAFGARSDQRRRAGRLGRRRESANSCRRPRHGA